jgi:hypothetical protein
MTRRPRVDSVTGSFFKRGRCKVCGKTTDRSRSFTADTYEAMLAKGEQWGEEPLLHKKCEPLWDPERMEKIGG